MGDRGITNVEKHCTVRFGGHLRGYNFFFDFASIFIGIMAGPLRIHKGLGRKAEQKRQLPWTQKFQ